MLLVALWFLAAAAGASPLEVPKGLVGVLTPDHVPDGARDCTGPGEHESLLLRVEPASTAPESGTISFPTFTGAPSECGLAYAMFTSVDGATRRGVPQLESSYEEVGLVVLEQRGEWFRIDLGDGSGWASLPASYRFDAYPQMLAERLAFATSSWTGEICSDPGEDCATIEPAQEQPLRVLGVGQFGGQDWVEVELTSNPCRDAEERVLRRGWIRAHAADGRPAAWFHSRGC